MMVKRWFVGFVVDAATRAALARLVRRMRASRSHTLREIIRQADGATTQTSKGE